MNQEDVTLPAVPSSLTDLAQVTNSSQQGGEFKLLKAYLVDSLSKGRIVEFALEGGAVLTGVNGRGKTSMLQMLLLFNGTNPSSLVSKGKSSFIEYYMPRSTSYIAFEYQRDDGSIRLVVAYTNSTADKVFYRFVRQGYERQLFVDDDGRLVKNRDFRARLSELKVACSHNQIETYADYRAVIHYNIPTHADKSQKSYLRSLCADYAFTRYNKPLTNMDRLAVGMFSRESNFDVLQSIVIESIFDNKTSHSIKTDRSKIELWPRNFRAYKEIMALRPTYDEVCGTRLEYEQDLVNLSGLREQVNLLLADFDVKEQELKQELEHQQNERNKAFEAYKADKLSKEGDLTTSKIKSEDLELKIKGLDEAKRQYDALEIPAKMQEYKKLEEMTKHLASLKERLATLTESHTPLMAKYDKIMAEISNQFSMQIQSNAKACDEIRKLCKEKLDELQARIEEQEARLDAAFEEKRSLLQDKVEALNEELGARKQNLANPQVPQAMLDALQTADDEVTDARKLCDAKTKDVQEKQDLYDKASALHEDAKNHLSTAAQRVTDQEDKVKAITEANTPHPDSLLYFLRNEVPEWRADIARVIRTDVLQRTDLSPLMGEKAAGVFGLELDLTQLDAAPESNPEYIAEQVKDEERLLAELKEKLSVAKDVVNSTEKALRQAQNEKSIIDKARLEAKSRQQVAESRKEKAQFDIEQAKKSALAQAQKAFDEAVDNLKTARLNAQQADDAEKIDKARRKTEQQIKLNQVRQEQDDALTHLANELKAKQIKRDIDLRSSERERDEALRAEGVDAQTLGALNDEIASVIANIKAIDELKPLVSKWVPWHREVYSTRDSLVTEHSLERGRLQQIEATIADIDDAHKKTDEQLTRLIASLELSAKDLAARRIKGEGMAERLKGFMGEATFTVLDESWTIDSLHLQMSTWLQELDEHRRTMEKQVSILRKGFEKYTNTSVHEYFEEFRRAHDTDSSIGYVKLFQVWFEERHREVFDIIRSIATVFSGEVADFHQKLKTFTDHLNRFNRDLQDHLLSLNSYFSDIEGLTVNIHSTVNELKSWSVISRMVESRTNWINQQDSLPDQIFVDGLEQLLEQWEVKSGITADFKHLISIRGEVRENGNLRKFKSSKDLDNVSSNGLSYLILIILFVAFWKKIKKDSPVNLIWALDELKVISFNNIDGMMRMLNDNSITLCSAFPDPDVSTLSYFKNAYTVESDRRLATVRTKKLGSQEAAANV